MAMWVDVYTRIYIILMSLSACSVASGLLCYTRPCLSSENNVCLKRCLELNATCSKKVTVNYGHHIVEEASCSPPLDNECSNEPRTCALKEINTAMYTSVTKVFSCCCKTDYCNGWFLDAIAIYPYLTLSRPLPLLPHTFTNHSDQLICETYYCIYKNYTNCYHSLLKCPVTEDHRYTFVCKSEYVYTDSGYLVPSFKGCVKQYVNLPDVEKNECHIDNSLQANEGASFLCHCIGDYCNENETFTHVIRLASYGQKECNETGCQYDCHVINGEVKCQCPTGYKLKNATHCKDINECHKNNGGCDQKCFNTVGSFQCGCYAGFTFDSYGQSCESIEGVYCWHRFCFSGRECTSPTSIHCSNSPVMPDTEEENVLKDQFCVSYYNYYIHENIWRPFQDSCELSRYFAFADCLDKTECHFEIYDNTSLVRVYRCCCRGNNCNDPFNPKISSLMYVLPTVTSSVVGLTISVHVSPNLSAAQPLLDVQGIAILSSSIYFSILLLVLSLLIIPLYKVIKWKKQFPVLKFSEIIYKGKFTQLQTGSIQGTSHLIKLFNNKELWESETDLMPYLNPALNDVLQFEQSSRCFYKGLLIHCLIGRSRCLRSSLRDFLKSNKVSLAQLKTLALSAAESLMNLHYNMTFSRQVKYTIAHRFINSDSFMVSDDMSCVLTNLEYAIIIYNDNTARETETQDPYSVVNEVRYLAPEILQQSADTNNDGVLLAADTNNNDGVLLAADIYALGLVIWEIISRCNLPNKDFVFEYNPPFMGQVPASPTVDDMKKLIIEKAVTPKFPAGFLLQQEYTEFAEYVAECWYFLPQFRPSAKLFYQDMIGKTHNMMDCVDTLTPHNMMDCVDTLTPQSYLSPPEPIITRSKSFSNINRSSKTLITHSDINRSL